jgi:hypothetical protein
MRDPLQTALLRALEERLRELRSEGRELGQPLAAEPPDDVLERIWRFLRGDTPPREFELWACSEPDLEARLGNELFLEIVSARYTSLDELRTVSRLLVDFALAERPLGCACLRLPDLAVVDMGDESEEVFRTLDRLRSRGDPQWWLFAARCRSCGELWLVAEESRQNDLYCLRRLAPEAYGDLLEGRWPAELDTYEALLRIGLEAGRSVRFLDPLTSSLVTTAAELIAARPSITLAEIATLLNVSLPLAQQILEKALPGSGRG